MAVVTIKIGGRDYQIACNDGEEDHLRLLSDDIDDRVRSLMFQMGSNPGEAMTLLLVALTMSDEAIENKKENEKVLREVTMLQKMVGQPASQAPALHDKRLLEMENAMASTLDEIAARIEKIAKRIEKL